MFYTCIYIYIYFLTLWDDCTICLVWHAGENKRRETSKAKENQMMLSRHLYNHLYKPKHHDNHFAKHGHLRTPQLERDRKRPGNLPSGCDGHAGCAQQRGPSFIAAQLTCRTYFFLHFFQWVSKAVRCSLASRKQNRWKWMAGFLPVHWSMSLQGAFGPHFESCIWLVDWESSRWLCHRCWWWSSLRDVQCCKTLARRTATSSYPWWWVGPSEAHKKATSTGCDWDPADTVPDILSHWPYSFGAVWIHGTSSVSKLGLATKARIHMVQRNGEEAC